MSNKDIKMMGKDTEMSFTRGKRTGFRNDMALREVGERHHDNGVVPALLHSGAIDVLDCFFPSLTDK
jgi:hypothetical protein